MGYQNIGKPRFYIDIASYFNFLGIDYDFYYDIQGVVTDLDKNLLGLNPNNMKTIIEEATDELKILCNFKKPWNSLGYSQQSYIGFINHNLSGSTYRISDAENNQGIINTEMVGNDATIPNNGFSLSVFSTEWEQEYMGVTKLNSSENNVYAGCFTLGFYYDMPNSADLDLTMSVEFDGYNSMQTLGGSTLTNVRYSGSPWWYDVNGNKIEPWAIGESTGVSKRNGRRTWALKFSYMSDKDLFASNYMSNTYTENADGYDSGDIHQVEGNDTFYYTLDNDDSFVAQVLNKVGNGQRFIFQPDNTNNNPDQFAICQLDQDSLDIKQVANTVYDISLKIREVW